MKRLPAPLLPLASALSILLSGCAVEVARPQPVYVPPARVAYVPATQASVVSVYIEPSLFQPQPIAVAWAPPPMLVEPPPPQPFAGSIWTGGYWAWQGNWVWAAGRWLPPPRPDYIWVHPYYEHRADMVVFIDGHWAAPGVAFVPPAPTLEITVVRAAPGVVPGPRPIGPPSVFVPAPPGSRPGIIVPASIGTPPSVVVSAPPVSNVGMRVQNAANNMAINNTRAANITNVTVVAPAGATTSGRAYEATVPAQAHLAAVLPAVVHIAAPAPATTKPVPAFVPGHESTALPPAQTAPPAPASAAAQPAPRPNPAPAANPAPPASVEMPATARPLPAVAPKSMESGQVAPVRAAPLSPETTPISRPATPSAPPPPKEAMPAAHENGKAAQQPETAAAKAAREKPEAEKAAVEKRKKEKDKEKEKEEAERRARE